MRTISLTVILFLVLAVFVSVVPCRANDLDDGIETDDSVEAYNDISSSSRNFSYLAQRARSKAASGGSDVILSDGGVLNSVILESGAAINGDIIIIDDSKGDKTIISE